VTRVRVSEVKAVSVTNTVIVSVGVGEVPWVWTKDVFVDRVREVG
jgi:hypothetical protein